MDWRLWRSLRFRLMLLVLLALLPSLGLLYLTADQQRNDALASGQDDATRIARLVAADQQTVSSQVGTVMSALALNPDLQVAESCSTLLANVLDRGAESPSEGVIPSDVQVDGASLQAIAVVDADGDAVCTAGGEGALTTADREVGTAAMDRGRLVTGHLEPQESGVLRMTYAVPVAAVDGGTAGALVATVDITTLGAFAVNANLPAGTAVLVLGREGERLQWYPPSLDATEPVSLTGTPGVADMLGEQARGAGETMAFDTDSASFVTGVDSAWSPGIDGTTRISYTLVLIPEATVVQQATEKFNENLGKLAIAGIVGLVAAWVGADLVGGRDAGTRMGLIRDYYHIFETGQTDRLEQIVGANYVDRSALPDAPEGLYGLRQNVAAFRSAFPDGRFEIRDLLADHDTVMARVRLTGTQTGEYFGIPPANQPVSADGVETFRFLQGMVVESWSLFGPLQGLEPVTPPVDEAEAPPRGRLLSRIWRRVRRDGRSS